MAGHAGLVAAGCGIRGARRVKKTQTTATRICTRTLAVEGGNQSAADLHTVSVGLNGTGVLRMRRSGGNLTLPRGRQGKRGRMCAIKAQTQFNSRHCR